MPPKRKATSKLKKSEWDKLLAGLSQESTWLSDRANHEMVSKNRDIINDQIEYCHQRIAAVGARLAVIQDPFCLFNWGSSIVLLSSFNAALAMNQATLKPVRADVVKSVQKICRDWLGVVTPGPRIDCAEGARGCDLIPGIEIDRKMRLMISCCPDLPEWADRFNREKATRWRDLTLIVTLQWVIAKDPVEVVRFAVEECLRDMPRPIGLRAKKSKMHTLNGSSEYRIYCATHIVLVLSEFGSQPIRHASMEELIQFEDMLGGWLLQMLSWGHGPTVHNREVVTEVAACLLILKVNGVPLQARTLAALRVHTLCCLRLVEMRSKEFRKAAAGARKNVYVEEISNDQPRGEKGGLYVDYHTHYLIGLFYMLVLVAHEYDHKMASASTAAGTESKLPIHKAVIGSPIPLDKSNPLSPSPTRLGTKLHGSPVSPKRLRPVPHSVTRDELEAAFALPTEDNSRVTPGGDFDADHEQAWAAATQTILDHVTEAATETANDDQEKEAKQFTSTPARALPKRTPRTRVKSVMSHKTPQMMSLTRDLFTISTVSKLRFDEAENEPGASHEAQQAITMDFPLLDKGHETIATICQPAKLFDSKPKLPTATSDAAAITLDHRQRPVRQAKLRASVRLQQTAIAMRLEKEDFEHEWNPVSKRQRTRRLAQVEAW